MKRGSTTSNFTFVYVARAHWFNSIPQFIWTKIPSFIMFNAQLIHSWGTRVSDGLGEDMSYV